MMPGSGEKGERLDAKRNTSPSKCRQTILSPQGQSLPEGKEPVCVRGRDAYTGADLERAPEIDHVKLPAKERNQYVFKGEADCLWCMRVGFIDTFREKLFLKKSYHISRSSGFISNT